MPGKSIETDLPIAVTGTVASIPDHELIRLIGSGSYGGVWLARSALGSHRAIKIVYEKDFRHRNPFEREFRGVQKFEPISRLHENLVDILQVGHNVQEGYFYCVMELADDVRTGQLIDPNAYLPQTLAREVRNQKRLSVEECLRIGVALGSALDFLHGRGLIHRDIKPSNVVFVSGIPKLADIGLVVETTEAKSYVGTEGFIPPEGPGTVQADIYSLGKLLYEISSGKDRYDYPDLPTQLGDPGERQELVELNRIIWKACRSDPKQRYRSAGEMVADLEKLRDGGSVGPERSRKLAKRLLISGGALCLLVAGGLGLRAFHQTKPRKTPVPSAALLAQWSAKGLPSTDTWQSAGLVGWWRGEGNVNDSAGTNHGILDGVTFTNGELGQAMFFTGNASVRILQSPELDVGAGDGFTVEAWINPVDVAVANPIVEWNNGKGYETHLFVQPVNGPGTLYANLVGSDGANHAIASPPRTLVNGQFQHVALTYDRRSGLASLYRNGEVVTEATLGQFTPDTRDDLYVGRRVASVYPNDTWSFGGAIDEVSLYNRALTQAEIQSIYNAGIDGKRLVASPNPSHK